jgi:thiaminase/transcriptional activator TenA
LNTIVWRPRRCDASVLALPPVLRPSATVLRLRIMRAERCAMLGATCIQLLACASADSVVIDAQATVLPWEPGGFTHEMMQNVSATRALIVRMPFLEELVAGTLPTDTFAFYLTQDSLYLRQYSRVLANLASRAPTAEIMQNMARASDMTLIVEGALHEGFLSKWSSATPDERRATEQSPTCAAYTDWMQARVAFAPYEVGYAAAIPCYTIYAEVGRYILSLVKSAAQGSGAAASHDMARHPYKEWIETYGGAAFEAATQRATTHLDELASRASVEVRAEMREAFRQGARFEWQFWDSAYRREQWPIAL